MTATPDISTESATSTCRKLRCSSQPGGYQKERRVYGLQGERIVIATRSSCYCPSCQR